jgi:hypothetical protein
VVVVVLVTAEGVAVTELGVLTTSESQRLVHNLKSIVNQPLQSAGRADGFESGASPVLQRLTPRMANPNYSRGQ